MVTAGAVTEPTTELTTTLTTAVPCVEEGVDLKGTQSIVITKTANAAECQAACAAKTTCRYFVWVGSDKGKCYLKATDDGRTAVSDQSIMSGPRSCNETTTLSSTSSSID